MDDYSTSDEVKIEPLLAKIALCPKKVFPVLMQYAAAKTLDVKIPASVQDAIDQEPAADQVLIRAALLNVFTAVNFLTSYDATDAHWEHMLLNAKNFKQSK